MDNKKFQVRSKVWVQDDEGNVVFGLGRLRILEAIRETGSLRAAAQELGMGYRAIWARVRATEERLGIPILEKKQGGKSGGGSSLTPVAEQLLKDFKNLQRAIEKETDKTFAKSLEEDLDTFVQEHGPKIEPKP